VLFCAFDLLHLDLVDLRKLQLIERRAKLERLVGKRKPDDSLHSPALSKVRAWKPSWPPRHSALNAVSKREQGRYE